MMVNVLGHALLVEYLWDALLRKGQHPSSDTAETRPRIVTVGSELHRRIGQRGGSDTAPPADFPLMTQAYSHAGEPRLTYRCECCAVAVHDGVQGIQARRVGSPLHSCGAATR